MTVYRYGHLRSAPVVVGLVIRKEWEPPTLLAALWFSTRPSRAPPRWLCASPTSTVKSGCVLLDDFTLGSECGLLRHSAMNFTIGGVYLGTDFCVSASHGWWACDRRGLRAGATRSSVRAEARVREPRVFDLVLFTLRLSVALVAGIASSPRPSGCMCRCATLFYGKVEASSQRQHSQIQCGCWLLCVVWYVFSSLSLCSALVGQFRVDLSVRCGCARCCHSLRSCGTCSTGAAIVGGPRGPVQLMFELTVYTAGEPVVGYPGVCCNHEAPLVLDCSRFAHLAETLRAPAGLHVVTRQENLSLYVREFAIMKFRW